MSTWMRAEFLADPSLFYCCCTICPRGWACTHFGKSTGECGHRCSRSTGIPSTSHSPATKRGRVAMCTGMWRECGAVGAMDDHPTVGPDPDPPVRSVTHPCCATITLYRCATRDCVSLPTITASSCAQLPSTLNKPPRRLVMPHALCLSFYPGCPFVCRERANCISCLPQCGTCNSPQLVSGAGMATVWDEV